MQNERGGTLRSVAIFVAGFALAASMALVSLAVTRDAPKLANPPKQVARPNGYWIVRADPDAADFVDGQRIGTEGQVRTGWVYRVWRKPQPWKSGAYHAAKLSYRWDCATRRHNLVSGGTFDKKLALIEDVKVSETTWDAVFPESEQERALDLVCSSPGRSGLPFIGAKSFAEVAQNFWDDPARYSFAP